MANLSETLALALKHHQTGNLQEARNLYCQILEADPSHADALHLLGMLSHQVGQNDLAVAFIHKALEQNGSNPIVHSNLGTVYQAKGEKGKAEACYRRALALDAGSADTYINLGVALADQGKQEEALASYRQALKLNPAHALAHTNLGNLLKEQGKLDQAAACYREALRLEPESLLALNNLGNVLQNQGQLDEAQACFRKALKLRPDFAEVYNNLGSVLRQQGQLAEAILCYQQALRFKPDFSVAQNNLGVALMEQGKLAEALPHYQKSRSAPGGPGAAANERGKALAEQEKLEAALGCFQEAVGLQPDLAEAHNNLGNVLLKQGRREQALASYREALRLKPESPFANSNLLMCLNYDPQADPDAVFAEHRRWGSLHGQAASLPHANVLDPERRLRIGYVSPDFRKHAVTGFFEPILANHDPARFEAFCYAEVPAPDSATTRLKALAHGWHSTCGQSDAQAADQIRNDGIDILVDLAGHTANHRLRVFAHKPAPVQVTYLGYPNTTGLAAIDYKLTDAVLDPPGEPRRYTEELVRLGGGVCCFAPPPPALEVSEPPVRKAGRITFGSLHNLAKMNAGTFNLWSQVLQAAPSSRLLLFRNTLIGETAEFIRRMFTERGVSENRLELRHAADARGFLGVYQEIDVSLDVFPWTGHAVSCEALWMGVPIVTLTGKTAASRLTASVLTRLGLTELCAASPEQYVAMTVQLAADQEKLARLRAGLRGMVKAALGDGQRFTRGLEETYRSLWRRWCERR